MENMNSKSIRFAIAKNMNTYSDKTAVKVNNEELSYKEVNRIAENILSGIAVHLQKEIPFAADVCSGRNRIGIYLPRDRYLVPAIWALIKGKYTYVPLDSETPIERLNFIINDCNISAIVSEVDADRIFMDIPNVNVLKGYSGTVKDEMTFQQNEEHLSDVSYIIYTSGTTGKPKGVPVTEESLLNFLKAISSPDIFNISDKTRILCFASINFDASILDLIAPLYYGGTIILANEQERRDIQQLSYLIKAEKVTTALLPPSLLTLMPDFDFPSMDVLIVGGEKMLPSIVEKAMPYKYRLVNAYGPTENTVISTVRIIRDNNSPCENIGRAIPGVTAHVLHSDLTPVAVGTVGELYLGGIQLTNGYLNRPELNSRCFIPNPFPDRAKSPVLYKTGDWVRLMENGTFEFIGRTDTQVKFNGYRIELDEIAKAIEQCPSVIQACVLVETKEKGDSLVAFVKLHNESHSDQFRIIKEKLKEYLPYYMLPSSWIEVKEFPRNINGKIDKEQLLAYHRNTKTNSSTNMSEDENIMAHVIAHILEQNSIDANSDLFDDVGMTSIQIMQTPIELEVFGIYISVEDIYRNRSIRKILLNRNKKLHYWFNEPSPDKPVLVIVCGYTSFRFLYADLAKTISETYSIFVFESYHEYPWELTSSCEKLVQYYMKILQTMTLKYRIAVITGFCLGGELGLLLAKELYRHISLLPHVVVLDGEVSRSKKRDEKHTFVYGLPLR